MALTEKQIKEIREHLEKAQNPLFFFDNDPDGLCAFLLLRRFCEKGKGVPIRSFPELNASYFRKVLELKADYIFILDKPVIAGEFFKEVEKYNIPLVWIDHHEIQGSKDKPPEFVHYYNPTLNEPKTSEPTTYLCFQVANKKEDSWLAIVGCLSDSFIPEFYEEISKEYPDLTIKSKNAFNILYGSQIGKTARIFSFALKDSTTNVINMLKFLIQVKNPYEILEENKKNYSMHKRYKQIHSRYSKLLIKAEENYKHNEKILFFQYGGDLSISGDLANELSYRFPNKVIVVAYITGVKANISVRGEDIRESILKAIEKLEGATGGGHKNAVGVQIRVEDLEKFRENLEGIVK